MFVCRIKDELFFFSSPQPQNTDVNSSLVAATYLTSFPSCGCSNYEICSPIHGLVCHTHQHNIKGRTENFPMICNPSTGRSLSLPRRKTGRYWANNFFGYDPIDKEFKVLSIPSVSVESKAHQVMTLGTGELSWRVIERNIPHFSLSGGICINGVLYYRAIHESSNDYIIICFDVRLEKFSFIELRRGTLINYNGKLGLFWCEGSRGICGGSKRIELWVLEDLEKQEWSKHSYVLPALWESIVGNTGLSFVGVTRTNEVVLSSQHLTGPFYLFYFNLDRNTIVRVEIQGISSKYRIIDTFLDHVEDVKFLL